MGKCDLSVVVPAYNEGGSLEDSLRLLFSELNRFSGEFEVIVVNDGSSDDTLEKLKKLKDKYEKLHIISYRTNRGKGHAIRRGLERARVRYSAVIDADMEIHPCQILTYLESLEGAIVENSKVIGITGCKFDPDSDVDFPFYRRVMSMCYYKFLHLLFTFDIKDTQTGLKIFKTDSIKALLPLLRVDGFAYDVELLVAVYDNGNRMITAPVDCTYSRDDRRIHFRNVAAAFLDTIDVFAEDVRGAYRKK